MVRLHTGNWGIRWALLLMGVAMAAAAPSARGQDDPYLQTYVNVLLRHYGQVEGDNEDSGRVTFGAQPSGQAAATLDGVFVGNVGGTDITAFPHAFGLATASANGGDLHAKVSVGTTTDLPDIRSGSLNGGYYLTADATARAWWHDSVTIETDNPAGSDLYFRLKLDGSVSWDYDYDYLLDGSFGVGVDASITGSGDTGIFTLDTYESVTSGAAGGYDFQRYAEKKIHVPYGTTLNYGLSGQISAGASASELTAFLTGDVSHTALFAIHSDDPLLHYTSQSGTVYASDTPEPTAGALGLICAAGLCYRRRQA